MALWVKQNLIAPPEVGLWRQLAGQKCWQGCFKKSGREDLWILGGIYSQLSDTGIWKSV